MVVKLSNIRTLVPALKKKRKATSKPQSDLHAACYELRLKLHGTPMVSAVGVGREDGHDLLIVHTRPSGTGWYWSNTAVPKTWMGFRVVTWASSSAPSFIGGGNSGTINTAT